VTEYLSQGPEEKLRELFHHTGVWHFMRNQWNEEKAKGFPGLENITKDDYASDFMRRVIKAVREDA